MVTSQNEIIRCFSVEYNEALNEKYPERSTIPEFEKWMKKAKKEMLENPSRQMATYNIPVIFHVIHNGQTQGATPNVSQALIQAQLDQLNIDFSNMAGSSDPVAADADIEFCLAQVDESGSLLAEPGINRRHRDEFGFSAPSWTTTYVDNTIKPATQWDPDLYCNIWVLDISGGVLGWAQFPDNSGLPGMPTSGGPADEDGVVVLYSSVGSMAMPFGGGSAAYDNGRTLTHEIGHWLGLRHIWGDGGCTVDDFCNDTPESDGSNFGCPNHTSCGTQDMVENYMDYTDDDCMDIFTFDQVARMHTVLTTAAVPRRGSLLSSTVCTVAPVISFKESSTSIIEGTDCNSTSILVEVVLSTAGSNNPGALVVVDAASTASSPDDFSLGTAVVTWPSGSSGSQFVNVIIQQDGLSEMSESIVLKLTSPIGDGVIGPLDTHTITLSDDDPMPGSVSGFEYIDATFDSNMDGFSSVDGGDPGDTWYRETGYNGNPSNNIDGTTFIFVDSDAAGNGSTSYEELISPIINTSSSTSLSLQFEQYFRAYGPGYNEQCLIDVWNGSSWVNVYTRTGNQGSLGGWGSPDVQSIDVSAYANAAMQIRFTYDAEWDYWWALDNILLVGDINLPVETEVNSANGFASFNFGPNMTAHFIDENTGNLMMTLVNTSSHNYGCTTVEIDNAGTQAYDSPAPEAIDITDKNFIVSPQFNNPSGSYDITLYYTAAEIAGWESDNTQGQSMADLFMVKNSEGAVSSASTLELQSTSPVAYGTDWQFTASYSTGFSGFALANQFILPVEWLEFNAQAKSDFIKLTWTTAQEVNNSTFEILRSTDNRSFEKIGEVKGNGTTSESSNYSFNDENVIRGVRYYYQIKQIDFDGSHELSEIRSTLLEAIDSGFIISPNPVQESVQIITGDAVISKVEVFDVNGKLVSTYSVNGDNGIYYLNLEALNSGAYLIKSSHNDHVRDISRLIKI